MRPSQAKDRNPELLRTHLLCHNTGPNADYFQQNALIQYSLPLTFCITLTVGALWYEYLLCFNAQIDVCFFFFLLKKNVAACFPKSVLLGSVLLTFVIPDLVMGWHPGYALRFSLCWMHASCKVLVPPSHLSHGCTSLCSCQQCGLQRVCLCCGSLNVYSGVCPYIEKKTEEKGKPLIAEAPLWV